MVTFQLIFYYDWVIDWLVDWFFGLDFTCDTLVALMEHALPANGGHWTHKIMIHWSSAYLVRHNWNLSHFLPWETAQFIEHQQHHGERVECPRITWSLSRLIWDTNRAKDPKPMSQKTRGIHVFGCRKLWPSKDHMRPTILMIIEGS